MNERCYENDYIQALGPRTQTHKHVRGYGLSRFIDDEFSILILSFWYWQADFQRMRFVLMVLCEC